MSGNRALPSSIRRRGLRLRDRSLRFQLLLILVGLLSLSYVAVAGVTALALHGFLLNRLDQQLAAAGDRFSISLEHPSDGDADNGGQLSAVAGQAAGTLGARVLHGAVTSIDVVGRGSGLPPPSAGDTATVAALAATESPRTIRFADLGEYRVTVKQGADADLLVTGLPEHSVDETTARLLAIEAVVFGAALLLSGLIGAVSIRWSLRPLLRVAATAREVSQLPLSTGAVSLPEPVAPVTPRSEAGQVLEAFDHMLEHVGSALRERHASEDRLRRFIADASHELRTPVSVVRSHAEYARRAGGELPALVSEALTRIMAESDRMGHLLEDLLLLARLDSGRQLERASVDLARLVLDAVSDARVTGAEHVWRLALPEDEVTVDGDAHALHQVIANLLANADAHTPPGSVVTTAITTEPPGEVTVTVTDDGPGIPPDVLGRVFDRSVRADTARARTGGSGLGLSIVAAIVRAHHGTVTVSSQPGHTAFTVTLPRQGRGSSTTGPQ